MGGGLYGGHLPPVLPGLPLSTPSSRLSLCYDGTRLAITGPCPSTKSEYFLAVYTADGLEYLGGYTSSLYGNHPPDCYPWGSWQDGLPLPSRWSPPSPARKLPLDKFPFPG